MLKNALFFATRLVSGSAAIFLSLHLFLEKGSLGGGQIGSWFYHTIGTETTDVLAVIYALLAALCGTATIVYAFRCLAHHCSSSHCDSSHCGSSHCGTETKPTSKKKH